MCNLIKAFSSSLQLPFMSKAQLILCRSSPMHRNTHFHALVSIKPAPSTISVHMIVVEDVAVVIFVAVVAVVTMVGLQTYGLFNLIPNKVFLVLLYGFGVISTILLGIIFSNSCFTTSSPRPSSALNDFMPLQIPPQPSRSHINVPQLSVPTFGSSSFSSAPGLSLHPHIDQAVIAGSTN
ncbi:hypothetical protein FF1_043579 [Malus domestica]